MTTINVYEHLESFVVNCSQRERRWGFEEHSTDGVTERKTYVCNECRRELVPMPGERTEVADEVPRIGVVSETLKPRMLGVAAEDIQAGQVIIADLADGKFYIFEVDKHGL